MRSKSSCKDFCRFLPKPPHFTNKNDKHKPEKWETFFDAIFSESKIGNKFWPPKSSMGTLLPLGSSKNRSFFGKECRIPRIWVSQQHHLIQQHFGGHVVWKQHLLFLLPKIVDFIKTWKKSAPQMSIELWGGGEATFVADMLPHRPSTNILPNCNIT